MNKNGIELFWLPLGAGGHSVRWNGRVFEAVAARVARRPVCDLYHSALIVTVDGSVHAIEMGPVWQPGTAGRGVVAEGPVGARWLGRSALFRYEVRCWRGGSIPDLAEAVASPQRLSGEARPARRVLALVREVPTLTWGRDPGRVGDMWNSNSLVSWLLVSGGLDLGRVRLPERGRAPGWDAGVALAGRRVERCWE
ncbi:hypothetical protein [Nocardioides sp.]|uniref:hypothetical protein n=1 Tax=Nocardioides sp. TaxID=35761 RepID=UPI002734B802|nr:hypothetical protein [Nocardioides sp.]MDP3893878.1 hypothetical protein [Nocardioides sp.]